MTKFLIKMDARVNCLTHEVSSGSIYKMIIFEIKLEILPLIKLLEML